MTFDLATGRYHSFEPKPGIVLVRTSLGYPRGLRYRVAHKVWEVTPRRDYLHAPYDTYRAAYLAQLHGYGVEAITARFAEIAEATGAGQLVLLCFENLARPDAWCHRRLLAAFWAEQTGEAVPEIGPVPPGTDRETVQPTLPNLLTEEHPA